MRCSAPCAGVVYLALLPLALLPFCSAGSLVSLSTWPSAIAANETTTVRLFPFPASALGGGSTLVLTPSWDPTRTTTVSVVAAADGMLTASVPGGASAGIVLLSAGSGSAPAASAPLRVYAVPVFPSGLRPSSSVGTAGLDVAALVVAPGDVASAASILSAPSPGPSIFVACELSGVMLPSNVSALDPDRTPTIVGVFSYVVQSSIDLRASSATLNFTTGSLPAPNSTLGAAPCPSVRVYVSVDGGVVYRAATAPGGVPVIPNAPLILMSLYPNVLTVPWLEAHSLARVTLAATFSAAVDASAYVIDLPPVYSLAYFERALTLNASLVYVAGNEFKEYAVTFAKEHPSLRVLLMSSLRSGSLEVLPNLEAATARMYEAMFLAGIVAASSSPSGRLGFIFPLNHSSCFNMLNAFALGAQAAAAEGLTPTSASPPTVRAWCIGDFALPWNEKNAALDLLAGPTPIDVLYSTTDNVDPTLACINNVASNCLAFGLYVDLRLHLGDKILMSSLYNLIDIYETFLTRAVRREPWWQEQVYMSGLGLGVAITPLSPIVPLAAQAEVARRYTISVEDDVEEEVFCGDLISSSGLTLLNGTSGAVAPGLLPAIRHLLTGLYCLDRVDVYTRMFYTVRGVELLRGSDGGFLYVPPPQPTTPVWSLAVNMPGVLNFYYAITAMLFAVAVAASIWLLVRRRTDIVRVSNLPAMFLINTGAILSGIAFVQEVAAPSQPTLSDATCVTTLWLSGISFTLLYGALFAKALFLSTIINNTKLKRVRLARSWVLWVTFLVVCIGLCFLLALHLIFPRGSVSQEESSAANDGTGPWVWNRCGSITSGSHAAGMGLPVSSDALSILSGFQLLFLAWGSWLAFRTRKAPEGYGEALWVGLSIYNQVLGTVLSLVFAASVPSAPPPTPSYALLLTRIISPLITLALLYIPKVLSTTGMLLSTNTPSSTPRGVGGAEVSPEPQQQQQQSGGGGGSGGSGNASSSEMHEKAPPSLCAALFSCCASRTHTLTSSSSEAGSNMSRGSSHNVIAGGGGGVGGGGGGGMGGGGGRSSIPHPANLLPPPGMSDQLVTDMGLTMTSDMLPIHSVFAPKRPAGYAAPVPQRKGTPSRNPDPPRSLGVAAQLQEEAAARRADVAAAAGGGGGGRGGGEAQKGTGHPVQPPSLASAATGAAGEGTTESGSIRSTGAFGGSDVVTEMPTVTGWGADSLRIM